MAGSEPVVILYKSNACRHCSGLSAIWDKAPNKDEESVTSAMKKIYPKLRFFVLTVKDNTGKFDENTAPKDLIRYGKWFPQILLVPGRVWDNAMSKLGPKNDAEVVDGVQVMNGVWENGELNYKQKYDIRRPAEFGKWLKEGLENEDFKRANNGSGSGVVVPTNQTPANPIQPLLTNIVRPSNSGSTYVAAAGDKHEILHGTGGDVCAMRIISRPR